MSGYVTSVPLANQSLGQTQPTINTNFTQLNTIFAIDHVAFTQAAPPGGLGGYHNTVTLNKQTVDPAAVSVGPRVYAEQVTYPGAVTRTEEFIAQASGDGGAIIALTNFFNAPITAANGSSFLPGIPTGASGSYTSGGVVFKWGSQTGFSSGTVTFASSFPNNCWIVVTQPINSGAATVANDYVYVYGFTKTGFSATATKRTTLAANTITFNYIAIGN
jgi:hypothetical protein